MEFQSQSPKISAALKVSAILLLCLAGLAHNPIAAAAGSGSPQAAQQAAVVPAAATEIRLRPSTIHTRPIQVNVQMVVVGVTVTDPDGRVVTGLNKDDFRIYDEKVSQEITAFSAEDAPVSVGVIFDASSSMSDKMERSKAAAEEFFKTSNPDDEFMLIEFGNRPQLLSTFSSEPDALRERLLLMKSGGRTAMLDAIYLGLAEMKRAHSNRKALLIISDGVDNNSRYTEKDIERAVKESDTQIYGIAILAPSAFRWLPGEKSGPALLSRLAGISGGRMFAVKSAAELPDVAQKISVELRNEYVIGYKPSNLLRDGSWRHIRLEVIPPKSVPGYQVYNRAGYYAPTQ